MDTQAKFSCNAGVITIFGCDDTRADVDRCPGG
jgi:hypothetical protein